MFLNCCKSISTLISSIIRSVATSYILLVHFFFQGGSSLNEAFLDSINNTGKIHLTPTTLRGKSAIRFCICSNITNEADVRFAWQVIEEVAEEYSDDLM